MGEYIAKMNELTAALYAKVAGVTQHSMVQRSAIMNLYQDYCDGLFYFSFADCNGTPDPNNGQSVEIPTMSDDFSTLILKLEAIEWNTITSVEGFNNLAEDFHRAFIDLVDEHPEGYNSSSGTYGAASSLRENGEVAFNFKTHDDEQIQFLTYKYRVRVDTIMVQLLDTSNPPQIYQS